MAEPRKVQFVTLSAFAAGSANESRKRRLENEADINLDGDEEVETTATGAVGGGGLFAKSDDGDKAVAKKINVTVRLNLSLSEPSDQTSAEFNYNELIHNLQAKKNPPSVVPAVDLNDPFNNDERERLQMEALAKKFESRYANTGKKRKDRIQDLIDIGFGYDETDPFIDNSEAYDELVPASLTTKLGGFYINTGTLQFKAASEGESEGEDKEGTSRLKLNDTGEQVIKKRKRKEGNNLEDKKPRKNRVPKQGGSTLNLHRPEKKKRKKLMKDSLCLAAMLRRFTREKEEMRKLNPGAVHPGLAKPLHVDSMLPNAHLNVKAANHDSVSLADLTSEPAMMTLLGSANERELQDLLGDLDFSLLEPSPHVVANARENGLLGVGVPAPKAGAGMMGRGLGPSGGLLSPPPLPNGLPPPLIKRIEDLRAASRQFDQEGRKKFFTLDMNNILLDIELQVQEQPVTLRSEIYSHLEAFVPCNKEALLKRLKKLSLNIQDDRLRTPLLKLKLAVCSVMPEQIQRYNMDCVAKAAKQQPGEGENNGSDEEDEEKPGKRVMGPRKKFIWDDKLRSLLCTLVRVKLSCYELEAQCSLSVEDYLKAFMENEVKPLWPKGWMQARMLIKESRAVHSHLTGNLVKKRMVPGPKAKAKESPWIQRPLPGATSSSLSLAASRLPLSIAPSEPICLSDSLDEDLTAPSLDSISHALALLSNASKGLPCPVPSDSPLSPPPLQMPTSSPPSVTPHYPSPLATTSASQHPLSKMESAPLSGHMTMTSTSLCSTSSSSSSTSSMARLHAAGGPALSCRGPSDAFGTLKLVGAMGQNQNQRHVTMTTTAYRAGGAGVGGKLPPPGPSPSPPKPRPPPTASPLLPPHQKAFGGPTVAVGMAAALQGLGKSSAKASSVSNSNGSVSAKPPTSSPQPRAVNSYPGPQGYCGPSSMATTAPSPAKAQQAQQHQSNFITPMQATLTKSSHSNNPPIIKLTPRPPAPTPPPSSSSSSPSPSSSPSHPQMMAGQHQYSPKAPGFRPPFSVQGGGGQVKLGQGSYSFAGNHKSLPVSSSSSSSSSSSNTNNVGAMLLGSGRQDNNPSPSASHGQRQRTGGGANQGAKAVCSRASSGTLANPPTTSHLSQVSAGSPLLGSPPSLPLGFGMLGGLVPVSLPFQFPSLLNFTPPGTPGASGMGTAPSTNSGYALAQSDLMDLYKSLQSGSQAALPPHLQLAFSDANQSQGGDMKRKSH